MCDTTNRNRLVRVQTDGPDTYQSEAGADVYGRSFEWDTVITVTVGSCGGGDARTYEDPNVRLTVRPDGTYTLDVAGPGWAARPVVIAEGTIPHTDGDIEQVA